MIPCIAIDDEPLALEVIKKYAFDTPAISLLATFTDAIQAASWLKFNHADLIFLDIQMPDINGIRFYENLKEKPLVIFTTAFQEYAVTGFDLEALDYLVKPIKYDRFIKAVEKAQKTLEKIKSGNEEKGEFIFVKSEYQNIRIPINEIRYIEGLDDYIKIHLEHSPKPLLSLMSLKSFLEKLPTGQFMRVHRSFIVPVKNIRSIHNRFIWLGETKIPVGETYHDAVQEWLSGF
ncbi:MAG: LytTR family DNA-binding domain-containing protein [Bacteroidetes bacterium]|nr:LytTR family DNA-binding domain-containing protein [Bacteroidota bacterium]